jgi:cytoskeletal protein CcmA (bactofilin family)
MFSKPQQPQSTPSTPVPPASASGQDTRDHVVTKRSTSLISADLKLEGSITGGSEVQIDGSITGDVRVEHVTVGESGHVEGGIVAEAVEVRGRISGSITAKQVRLYSAAHVEGDITHEQLAIETGAFFQGRSLRLQRPATVHAPATPQTTAAAPKPASAPLRLDGGENAEARAASSA